MAESIFTDQIPTSLNNVEGGGIVTAVTFTPDVGGTITGIRFYATSTVGGVYTGQLYLPTSDDDPVGTGTGTLLGSKVFAGTVTPSAWNVIPFDTPVAIVGGSTYRATMHNTEGRYVSTGSFPDFTNGIGLTNGHLHAIYNGEPIPALAGDTLTQGTFAGSGTPVYPSNTFSAGNYFVDVVFEPVIEPAEGEAAFSLVLTTAGVGAAPVIEPAEGEAGWGLTITLAATGETPGDGSGAADFGIVFALATAGEAPDPDPSPAAVCGWEGIDPEALGVCSDWETYPEAVRDSAIAMASLFLWAATGRRFGVCPVTVYPSQSKGSPMLYQAYPVWPGSSGGTVSGPFLFGGKWFNSGTCDSCCNSGGCAIVLRGPVVDVREVLVDGEVVSPSAYRVDASRGVYLLVRSDGQCWPTCNDGSFEVTYGMGQEIPVALLVATALLACEYAKGLTGGPCKLPSRMTRLSRQGIDVEVEPVGGDDGRTGIRQVDDVIQALNPSKRQRPTVILSPDLPESCDTVPIWRP